MNGQTCKVVSDDLELFCPMHPTPRITLLLLTFNQESLVEAAVRSCLTQDSEPLEIVLSDDASTDGTYDILCALAAAYRGPHEVRVRRNGANLGVGEHYNAAVAECKGQLIVTAAGDDISLQHRVRTLVEAWDATGGAVDLVSSHLLDMTHDGAVVGQIKVDDLKRWTSPDDWVRKRPYVVGAAHAFTRRLFDRFGPIAPDVLYEDQIMALRASCLGGGLTVEQPLLQYRRGGLSSAAMASEAWVRRRHLLVKYRRQAAVFRQVSLDLGKIGRPDLCLGKVLEKQVQAGLILKLLQARNWGERWDVVRRAGPRYLGWTLFQALRLPGRHEADDSQFVA